MPTPDHKPTRLSIAEKHRTLMENADFWLAVTVDSKIEFDDNLRRLLRDDFISLREVLSVSPPNGVPRAQTA